MKTMLRISAVIAGTVLIGMVAAAFYLYFIFDPNDYKQQVSDWIKKASGRELTFQGDIRLSLFPWLAVKLGHMTLSNRAGFGPQPFAEVAGAKLSIRLLPMLLNRDVEAQTIILRGLTLNLGIDRAGRSNWRDLVAGTAAPAPGAGKSGQKSAAGGSGRGIERFLSTAAIGGLEVSDAKINWDDRATGLRVAVARLGLHTDAIMPGEPVRFRLEFHVAAQPAAIQSQVTLYGYMVAQPQDGRYAIDDMHLVTDLSGKGMPLSPVQVKLRCKPQLDLVKQTFSLSNIIASAMGATVTGTTKISQLGDTPAVSGQIEIKNLNVRKVIDGFTATPILTRDSGVLGAADAKINFDVNSLHANVRYLHVELDDSVLNGSVNVSDYAHPLTEFNVFVDNLNLDRYLPPDFKEETPAPATPASAAGAGILPVKTLRALKLRGELGIGSLTAYNLKLKDVKIDAQAAGGLIAAQPRASLYGGRYQGNIHADARSVTPRVSFDESLDDIRLEPLMSDLMNNSMLTGRAKVHAKFSLLADPSQMRRSLDGSARFDVADGAVNGVNIAQLIRRAKAQIEGRPLPAGREPQKTDFSELSGTLTARDGIVRNDDLTAKSPYLRLAGRGSVNLVSEDINYRVDATFVDTPAGQGGEELKSLKGVTVPIHVGGTLSRPAFSPDLKGYLKEHVQGRVKKELQKQIQKNLEKLFKQ